MKYQKYSNESNDLRQEIEHLRKSVGLAEEPKPKKKLPIEEVDTTISNRDTTASVENETVDFEVESLSVEEVARPAEAENFKDLFNERQIKTWDLVDINYLERGALVAKSVCKLHARDDRGPLVGTAFLISERLIVTNHHNLPNIRMARTASVEFAFELGLDGFPRNTEKYKLLPEEAYWIHEELDICVIAVAPISQGNVPITNFGKLELNPKVGKIDEGQFISLIHHPNGEFKQVSIRENQLLKKAEKVLWYASDTTSGSSGAPCFSDNWEVVAIHRKGVPKTKDGDTELIALRDGSFLTRKQIAELRIPESFIIWLANEGTRVSVFVHTIKADPKANANPLIRAWLANFKDVPLGVTLTENIEEPPVLEFQENRRPVNDYDRRNGYQSDFLGIAIPPPNLDKAIERWGAPAFNSDTGEIELPYYNFSVWMNSERRMCYFSAVNIDGKTHDERKRNEFGGDKWVYDDRLPERLQIGNWFYGNEPARFNRNYFDRGHIVRRTEPCWGGLDMAQLANDDTFHWTNCTPQYKDFNQRSQHWQGIEAYLLEKGAVAHQLRMSIFTGPIFSDEDTKHRSVLIPKMFFKVAVFIDLEDKLQAAGFVLDQSKWVEVIDFERAPVFDAKDVRRPISWIEEKTGLDFGAEVRQADAANELTDDLLAISELPHLFDFDREEEMG